MDGERALKELIYECEQSLGGLEHAKLDLESRGCAGERVKGVTLFRVAPLCPGIGGTGLCASCQPPKPLRSSRVTTPQMISQATSRKLLWTLAAFSSCAGFFYLANVLAVDVRYLLTIFRVVTSFLCFGAGVFLMSRRLGERLAYVTIKVIEFIVGLSGSRSLHAGRRRLHHTPPRYPPGYLAASLQLRPRP